MRTKILYEIETTSLMEALRTALEIQSSAKITPEVIEGGSDITLFNELDARSVIEGTRSIEYYRDVYTSNIDIMNPPEFCSVISEKPLGINRILRRLRYEDGKPYGPVVDHIYMKSSMEGGAL